MNDPKSISTITKKTQKNTQKPKPNQEHSIRSKKIHKTSQISINLSNSQKTLTKL